MEKDEIAFKLGELQGVAQATHDNIIFLKAWIVAHEQKDEAEHIRINRKISGLLKYAMGISIVSFFIGIFTGK